MSRKKIIERISEILKRTASDCTSILYGSEARGEARHDSDIDILIILPDNPETYAQRKIEIAESLYEVELDTGVPISPFIVLKEVWNRMKTPFTRNVEKDGILI